MDSSWYLEWARLHVEATAAPPEVTAALASDVVRGILVGEMRATAAELGQVTARLLRAGGVPKFPNEQADAVIIELRVLRREREAAAPPTSDEFPGCPTCGDGRGWVVVPLPRCVYHGEVAKHPETGRVYTTAVICESCEPGRRALAAEQLKPLDRQRPTLARYARIVYGADGIRLLADYERQRAAQARGKVSPGAGMADVFPQLAAKLAREGRGGGSGGF